MSAIYKTEAGEQELRRRYQEELRTWPVPADHLRVPTREGETFVLASGPANAPPVVLLHGSGANATMWRQDAAAWARHFRTYAVDLVGEPGLSAPSRPPLSSGAHRLWLDDVLEGLGLVDTALVGTSLGGWMALDYAAHRPDRVRRLALLCPGAWAPRRWDGCSRPSCCAPSGGGAGAARCWWPPAWTRSRPDPPWTGSA
ncbi:alpha/beta fold hydrolase [Nocardiopsis sp. ARC36]